MTNIRCVFLFVLATSFGCNLTKQNKKTPVKNINHTKSFSEDLVSKTDTLILNAINLSEDVTRFSTKNDEIILLMYDFSDTNNLNSPFLLEKITFGKDLMAKKLPIKNLPKQTLLFLIEEDSFKTLEQIEPIFRVYFKEIIKLQKKKNIKSLRKYLGDDDLLFSAIINKNTFPLNMKGMHMLINFEYNLSLKNEN